MDSMITQNVKKETLKMDISPKGLYGGYEITKEVKKIKNKLHKR